MLTATDLPTAGGGYPPIGDYAFIGDCRTSALVSRAGSIDWLCLPEFFSDALFAAVLDTGQGGRFHIGPAGPHRVSRRYLPDTAVLETTFQCDDGVFRLTDCMPICAGVDDELQPVRELLRQVEVLAGEPELVIGYDPRPGFGMKAPTLTHRGGLGWWCRHGAQAFVLQSELPLGPAAGGGLSGRARLPAGSRRYLSLSCCERDVAVLPPLGELAAERIQSTRRWWRDWSARGSYDGPYREMVRRSAITLKLMTYALSGAVVAAPTCSLPERIGGSRNWDYRYCWLRDAAFTLRSFLDLGYREEGEAFLGWLLHATRRTWPELKVLYTVFGQQPGPERELPHLEGYRGSRPVRVSNGAKDQLQLDVYGQIILAVHCYLDRGGRLDRYERRLLEGFARTVMRRWREPDQGIWETRAPPRHHTYSKLMCWAALNQLRDMARDGRLKLAPAELEQTMEAILAAIEAEAYNPRLGAYTGAFGSEQADAALLQLPALGYPARPGALGGTFRFIWERLARNGLVHRYGEGFDGLDGDEGSFGVCTFWAVSCLVGDGRLDEARALFERTLGYGNDLGLFAEQIDADSGAALGNFPQAFTHVGLIDAALDLAQGKVWV